MHSTAEALAKVNDVHKTTLVLDKKNGVCITWGVVGVEVGWAIAKELALA